MSTSNQGGTGLDLQENVQVNAFRLSEAYVDAMAQVWPVLATFQGVAGHDGEWNDYSLDGVEAARAVMGDFRRRLEALPRQDSPAGERSEAFWQQLAADFLGDMIERNMLFYGTDDALLDLNSIDSPCQHVRMVFDVMDTSTEAGRENVIRRLETIDRPLRSYRRLLEEGIARGKVVAARQVRACIEQCRVNAGDNSYFVGLADTVEGSAKGVAHARAEFAALADFLESSYLPHAPERDAVGRDRYPREVRRFLGATVDLDDTYAWGWGQVRTILDEMRRVAREIDADAPLAEVLQKLKTDPARCLDTPEAFAAFIDERQRRALRDLDGTHFDVPPEVSAVEVKLAPPGGPLGAYYIPPSEDFTRVGSIWYSLGDVRPIPLWNQISTAYHEGFPGHHLQCGLQVSLRDRLSKLQRLDGYSGYAEGWALYTELLMHELGYYEKPEYLLGMLACQMVRACRVVIDIGSHLELPIPADAPFHPGERWTFELAVEMLETLAGEAHDHAESEVTRYLGWPAQAISYKVGEKLILELRDELRKREGAAFNLKDFHNRVLGCGNVALERLRAIVLG